MYGSVWPGSGPLVMGVMFCVILTRVPTRYAGGHTVPGINFGISHATLRAQLHRNTWSADVDRDFGIRFGPGLDCGYETAHGLLAVVCE